MDRAAERFARRFAALAAAASLALVTVPIALASATTASLTTLAAAPPAAPATSPPASTASSPAPVSPPAAGQPFDYPRRASGLWEVRSVGSQAVGLPPVRQCVGPGSDTAQSHLDRSTGIRGACEFGPYRRSGKGWLAESVCKQGRTRITSRSVLTGDLASAYRIDTLVRYEPPIGGKKREDRDALEARRVGPCLDGQAPGDVAIPGMGTLNMVDGAFRRDPN